MVGKYENNMKMIDDEIRFLRYDQIFRIKIGYFTLKNRIFCSKMKMVLKYMEKKTLKRWGQALLESSTFLEFEKRSEEKETPRFQLLAPICTVNKSKVLEEIAPDRSKL